MYIVVHANHMGGLNTVLVSSVSVKSTEALIREDSHAM